MSATSAHLAGQTFTSRTWTFVSRVMKPVIRMFLRMGFSAEQISQMVRKLAVDVAMEYPEFRPPHRKRAFIAHAAVVTGLSRKEVAKLNEVEDLRDAAETPHVNRSIRVLGGWISDARYHDHTGRPLTQLPFKAAAGVSFHQLVREYGGDVPPRSVLDALIQRGAVRRKGNVVELAKGYPTLAADEDETLEFAGIMLSDALSTAEYDLRPGVEANRFFREWYQLYVPVEEVDAARTLIREETMAFGAALEQRLAELSHRRPKTNTEYRRLGLGAYYFETESPSVKD